MEETPTDVLEKLGYNLTRLKIGEVDFLSREKLVEVLHMELVHFIIPELANGTSTTFNWSDGILNIFISIHVEGEDQYSFNIELTDVPMNGRG